MQVTLVRHGTTHGNTNEILQGHLDGMLNESLIGEIKATGELLRRQKFHHIYSSDLRRCVDTLDILLDHVDPAPVTFDPNLREVHFGEWEGLPMQDVNWDHHYSHGIAAKAPGGESLKDLYNRSVNSVNDMLSHHQNENVLVVTHGGVIRAVLSAATGLDFMDVDKLGHAVNAGAHHIIINDPLPPVLL